MDIKSAEQSFQDVTFGDDSYDNLLNHFHNNFSDQPYHLCLLIGKPEDHKEEALNDIAEQTDREIFVVDANEVISKVETETYEKLDHVFAQYNSGNSLLYLKNGSRLCGSYMGYTQSSVKYATPQERYFFKKVQEKGGLFVVDIAVSDDTDNTIRRAAQSIINFPPPQSGLKRFFWRLKKVGVHGHEIKTDRPEHYRNKDGNF